MKYLRTISIVAILVGLPLATAPWWWPHVVGGGRAWSNAQASEYSQAAANFHRLAHDSSQRLTAEASAAAARYREQRGALENARGAGQTAATVMQCLGITTVFAGLLGCSAIKRESNPA